jgi:hypothetical protein
MIFFVLALTCLATAKFLSPAPLSSCHKYACKPDSMEFTNITCGLTQGNTTYLNVCPEEG